MTPTQRLAAAAKLEARAAAHRAAATDLEARARAHRLAAMSDALDITPSAARILEVINAAERPLPTALIVRRSGVSYKWACHALATLLSAGLVSHPTHGRWGRAADVGMAAK